MGQGEILQFLKENKGQMFTSGDIMMALDMPSATKTLTQLRKYPPEGFNFSQEILLFDKKVHSKTVPSRVRMYVYWY